MSFRGLTVFIGDIRNCRTKEAEQARVDKELANIRKHFTSNKSMSAYDRKKYVWKLVYIYLLGYEVDFGHTEVINLVSAGSYAEKTVGYLAASVLLKNTDEQITLIVQCIRNDLQSPHDSFQCLALSSIANIGGTELADSLAPDVQRLMMSRTTFPVVRKRSTLCMLRLFRVNPETLPVTEWAERIITLLSDDSKNPGVLLAACTLILGTIEKDPRVFAPAVPQVLALLRELAVVQKCPTEYMYHQAVCPWLQVALLRILQYYPLPEDATIRGRMNEVLSSILTNTEVTKSVNKNNGEHAVLFEAVNIVIKQAEECHEKLRALTMKHLSRFINIREPNIRYLGLEAMSRIAKLDGTSEEIRKQQAAILVSLKDADISLRRRALDLLYAICHQSNAEEVVHELLTYLVTAEFAIKDEMVLKTAILAERYAPNLRWYVDTILQLINVAGDHISDDIWHRAVRIVTNNEDLQAYAARKMYDALQPPGAHESAVKVGGYILGEFGYLLNQVSADGAAISGVQQFAVLEQHFAKLSAAGKGILLSAFAKMQNLYPELIPSFVAVFDKYSDSIDAELQQRSVEYKLLPTIKHDVVAAVLDAMPKFPDRDSVLETRLERSKAAAKDTDVWAKEAKTGGDAVASDSDDEDKPKPAKPTAVVSPPVVHAAPPAPAVEVDLLGLGGTPVLVSAPKPAPAPAPVPAPAPFTAAAPAPTATGAPTVPVTARVGVDPSAAPQLRAYFRNLLVAPSGVLFEDAAIMVGVQSQAAGPVARMMLHFKNKSSVPLTSFRIRVPPQPQLKVEIKEEPAAFIGVGDTLRVQLTVESLQPFQESPQLQLSFISVPGTGHAYPLRLPFAVSTFVEGVAMSSPDFDLRWANMAGEPREASFSIPASGGLASMEGARAMFAQLHFAPLDAPGFLGVRFAGSFRTNTPSRTGDLIAVGALAQVTPEPMTNSYHVSIRTQHGDMTAALKALITTYFA